MKLTCPSCDHQWRVDDHAALEEIECPNCGVKILMPQAPTAKYSETPVAQLSPVTGRDRPTEVGEDQILEPGTIIGQYRITGFLGRGGMGAVYRADHTLLQRTVALKVLPKKFAHDPEFVQRFQREARALAGLNHPGIVGIHDMGQQGDIYFFAMEFVEGVNLRELVKNKRLAPEQALQIVPKLCEALEYAHQQGVIHRDIKPENIILDKEGNAKIADFGLAKIVKGESGLVPLTQTNVIMGTVEYMAPEQRDNLKRVDHRADIYSLGVVLYEMLTGELPVGKFEVPSRRVKIDVKIDEVVLKALESSPDQRYQKASHMGTDVREVATSAAASGPLKVQDLRRNKTLGECEKRILAVRLTEGDVDITGWDRPEIGIDCDNGIEFDADPDRPTVGAQSVHRISVFVPRNVQCDVAVHSGDVSARSLFGTLTVICDEGEIRVEELDGRLDVRTKDGDVLVSRLRTDDFQIRTKDGDVSVRDLRFAQGRGNLETEDGDIWIGADQAASSFRFTLNTRDGSIQAPGHEGGRTATGVVGEGRGSLYARTADGDITIQRGVRVDISGQQVKDFWHNLTPKDKEKIGVFLIVNAALFLFFMFVTGTIIPFLCVFIFWGMSIALDLWKRYARGGFVVVPPPPPKPPVAQPVPPQAVEAPDTGKKRRELSITATLVGILAFLTMCCLIGTLVLVSLDETQAALGELHHDMEGIRIGLMSCALTTLVLALMTIAMAMAQAGLVRESKGRLMGGTLSRICFLSAIAALIIVGVVALPRVHAVQEDSENVYSVWVDYYTDLVDRDWEGAYGMLTRSARSEISKDEFQRRANAVIPRKWDESGVRAWPKLLQKDRARMTWYQWDETRGAVWDFSNEVRLEKEEGRWRIRVDKKLKIGVRDESR